MTQHANLTQGFIESLTRYQRRKTSTVKIGDLLMGSDFPIRIQSMTTTDTMDVNASVEQIIRLVDAGCELVRLTAPSMNEAHQLAEIKNVLSQKGIRVPLVADIHFTPNAAETAARIVEKVRVNPGNYADKKKFAQLEYTDASYAEELDRIREKFIPLVRICKEYGTALRIGTNHGSLSDRIMSRYGDSPLGMVESAMEFLRICEDEKYYNIVLSMKSSNPQVMMEAYRLLVKTMNEHNMYYPLHLGVTEAGDGNDGRIKSAMGIGALLADGIGDTIRVSLTEDPEFEIPVAQKLVALYPPQTPAIPCKNEVSDEKMLTVWNPFAYTKRVSTEVQNIGGHQVPRVIADFSSKPEITPEDLAEVGHIYEPKTDKWMMSDIGCDFIYRGGHPTSFMLPNGVKGLYDAAYWMSLPDKQHNFPVFQAAELKGNNVFSSTLNFVRCTSDDINADFLSRLTTLKNTVLLMEAKGYPTSTDVRNVFVHLATNHIHHPVIFIHRTSFTDTETDLLSHAAATGISYLDGFGDGIMLSNPNSSPAQLNSLAFGILQAARARITKTEYISCPSCGRTLFDLQETTALIRKHTDHLKGIKIAIMGCIVNGPGEMADADYGYVGSGPGKITLYRSKDIVKKGVNKETAVQELIELIRQDGNWTEKSK